MSTLICEDGSDSTADRYSETESLQSTSDVKHYSILRRYNEFLELYEQVRATVAASEGDSNNMPPFPVKEFMLPSLVGLLWRVSSSKKMLEERRAKFEALLVWIENHPTARNCHAFVKFLGTPPQTKNGYVSLKGYTSPDWLSSLQQVTKGVEDRKRRYPADSSSIKSLLERSSLEMSLNLRVLRHQRLQAAKVAISTCVLGKRQKGSPYQNRRYEPPCKKVALPAGLVNTFETSYANQAISIVQSRGKFLVAR